MKIIIDCFGSKIRLTEERLDHIATHSELKELTSEIERVLTQPEMVRRSRSDDSASLFYQFYHRTLVGGKWFCVVVNIWSRMRL